MTLNIGQEVNVQNRFAGVITVIDNNREFPYYVKAKEGFGEWCSETELYDIELDPID